MWSNPGKGVAASSTPRCSSYWKESFRVALDYNRQLYYTLLQYNIDSWFYFERVKNKVDN